MQASRVESDAVPDVPPHRATEWVDMKTSSSGGKRRKRKPPKITVKSAPGKPLDVDMEPIDAVRLVSAFGTTEPSFASWMLNAIINAACDGGPAHPPGAEAINDALAAV